MAAPTTPDDAKDRITKENRHQFLETAIASVSEADHEIRQAEARGRARRVREEELRHTVRRVAIGAVCLLVLTVAALVVTWFLRSQ